MVSQSKPANEQDNEPKAMTPQLRRRLQECYEHAAKLMKQDSYDFDYAHTMFGECVSRDPGNVVYLEALFENLRRKYNNNKKGALLNFGGKGAFKKAHGKEAWSEVMKLGPGVLKLNPWDPKTLRGLAEACAALGHLETELRYLRFALERNANDVAVNRHCAKSLMRQGYYDQAIACWYRVDEATRGDAEAQKMMSELQIEKTQAGLGKSRAAQQPDDGAGDESGAETAKPRREIQLTPRQQMEQALANSPTDVDGYLELTQFHLDEGHLGEALLLLKKGLSATGNDIRVQHRLEDVEILRKRQQLTIAEQQAAKEPNEQSQQLVLDLLNDLNRYELDVFAARSARYPADLECKFQLGLRLKRMENYVEAVNCFMAAAELPDRRASAVLELGECLQRQKQYSKALECYLRGLDQAEQADEAELIKLALYRAGLLSAGLKDNVAAIELLTRLVELDLNYKDAGARLDKIRLMDHK
jgi:tetratricopeptide (TPR) repeat protein